MQKVCYVYAKCNSGHTLYLRCEFTGTRYACDKFIRDRGRQGRPTHFLFTSLLDIGTAARRYL